MRAGILVLVLALVPPALASAGAAPPPELRKSQGLGVLVPGRTYQASVFQPVLRLRAPERGWRGGQEAAGKYRYVTLLYAVAGMRGDIQALSTVTSTPSPAATIRRLLTNANKFNPTIEAENVTATKVGGFSGQAFNGLVVGSYGWAIAPYPRCKGCASNRATGVVHIEKGLRFRIVAINVRGKTVVFILASHDAEFERFLAAATRMLATFRFRATA